MKLGSTLSSEGFSRLLKPAPFCAILSFVILPLLISGDESNLGPITIDKVVKASFHQGDPKFGDSAGSQCMCNALWSICYSAKKVYVIGLDGI